MTTHSTRRRGVRGVVAAALAAVLALGAGVVLAIPAQAASHGVGWNDGGNGWLGSYTTESGVQTYCLEPLAGPPAGFTTSAGVQDSNWAGIGALATSQLAWLVSADGHGVTGDANTAAATALVVWQMANPGDLLAQTGQANYQNAWKWLAGSPSGGAGRVPLAQRAAVLALADQFYAEALAYSPSSTGANTAAFAWNVDAADDYNGSLTVSLDPVDANGTLTLTNGVFTANGTSTIAITGSTTLAVRGVPPTDDGAPYHISAHGDFLAGGYKSIQRWSTPGRQELASAGAKGVTAFTGDSTDPFSRRSLFTPQLTSVIGSRYVSPGEVLTDTIVFNSGATTWRQWLTGDYATVLAQGTAYLSATEPLQSATVPADAVVIGYATVTSDAANYAAPVTATLDAVAPAEGGFVTWVWTISGAGQVNPTALYVDPAYEWASDYGIPDETGAIAEVVTQAQDGNVALPFHDVAMVTGAVFPGTTIAASLYKQASTLDAIGTPTMAGEPVCDASTLVATTAPVPAAVGTVTLPDVIVTEAAVYQWVETTTAADGTVISTGDCNDTRETAVIRQVTVVTDASVISAGTIQDVAHIVGSVPAGATIEFDVYDRDGKLVEHIAAVPVAAGVTEGLDVRSARVTLPDRALPGGYFVETLRAADGTVLAKDAPGLPNESFNWGGRGQKSLANTGSMLLLPLGIAGVLVVLALVLVAVRRRTV